VNALNELCLPLCGELRV